MVKTSYLEKVFNHKQIKNRVVKAKKLTDYLKPDCLYVRGVSGITFGSMLSYETGIPLLICRKSGEASHSPYRPLEGYMGDNPLLIDDFPSTGATLSEMMKRYKQILTKDSIKNVLFWEDIKVKDAIDRIETYDLVDLSNIKIYTLNRLYIPKRT